MFKKAHNTAPFSADFLESCRSMGKQLGLSFTFRSAKYLLDFYGISFGQLKTASFYAANGPYIDKKEACIYLIKAGLIGSKQITPTTYNRMDKTVNSIIRKWPKCDVGLEILHKVLIEQCEERHHFFKPAAQNNELDDLFKLFSLLDINPPQLGINRLSPASAEYWKDVTAKADKELRLNIKDAIQYGTTYEEALDMDIRLLTMYIHAKQLNYQSSLNDQTIAEIRLAIKIAEAVHGNKKVTDNKPIDLNIPDDEEFISSVEKRNAMVLKAAYKMYEADIKEYKAKGLI